MTEIIQPTNQSETESQTTNLPNEALEIEGMSEEPQTSATVTPDVEAESLKARIAELEKEVLSNLDGWQRSRAEFSNYKRRTNQELSDAREYGALDALAKVVPIMDDFERALDNIPAEFKDHPWMNGTALILKNMHKILDQYKIEVIDPVGQDFDPKCHEAIGTEDSDYETGKVSTTLQKGYRSGERILRPALVRVAN